MSFSQFNFNPNISKALQICGYQNATPIQLGSIPVILDGNDVVASSHTGSGKTAAFILPVLQRLSLAKSTMKPRVLVLTPTRELATQIIDASRKYGKFLNFNMVTLVGGASYRQQLKGLSKPCDIIVATPGRLLDHMQNKKIDLSGIEMLILDEADRMLDMGFIDDVKMIAKATPYTRQTLLFSATIDDRLSQIIRQLLKEPIRIDLTTEKLAPASIKQQLYVADNIAHKNRLLNHFLINTSIYKAIIFSATKVNADKLAGELRAEGLAIAPLHGDLKQAVRNRTLEQFRRGKIQYLIATDVAARGIDVPDVSHVINYDLPKFSEDYAHRIGRTGRAGKDGIAISFALPMDARHLQKIERFMGQRLEIATISGLEATKSITSQGSSSRKDGGRKKRSHGNKSRFSDEKRKFRDKDFDNRRRSSEGKKYGESFASNRHSTEGHSKYPAKKYSDAAPKKQYSDGAFSNERNSKHRGKKYGDGIPKKQYSEGAFRNEKNPKHAEKNYSDGAPRKSNDGKKHTDKVFRKNEVFRKEERFPVKRKKFGDKPFSDEGHSSGNRKSLKLKDKKEDSSKGFGKKKMVNNTYNTSSFAKKKKNKY